MCVSIEVVICVEMSCEVGDNISGNFCGYMVL